MCEKHSVPLTNVCGEFRCGLCYEEVILTEKATAYNQDYNIILVDSPDGHKKKVMRAFRNGKEI